MALTPGALSKVKVGSSTASLSSAAATGGSGTYTYQWNRSTTSGFTPAASTAIAGATALTLNDSGLQPQTAYFYVVEVTDTGSSVSAASSQLEVDSASGQPSPNQFAQAPYLGTVDQAFNYNTRAVQIDSSSAGGLRPGQAVKVVNSQFGVPKVVECAADTDEVFGFINYNFKNQAFNAYDRCEISQKGNVIYLTATNAIARGAQVQLDLTYVGGVAAKVGSSGANLVGTAYDEATGAGQLIRVTVDCPSFLFA